MTIWNIAPPWHPVFQVEAANEKLARHTARLVLDCRKLPKGTIVIKHG